MANVVILNASSSRCCMTPRRSPRQLHPATLLCPLRCGVWRSGILWERLKENGVASNEKLLDALGPAMGGCVCSGCWIREFPGGASMVCR